MADFQRCEHLELPIPPDGLCWLNYIVEKQKMLTEHYLKRAGYNSLENLTPEEKNKMTLLLSVALEDEISELRGQINWKWWKKEKNINEKELKFEIIDMFFFTLTTMLIWGMSAEEITSFYMAKHEENIRRQQNGY